LISGWVPAAGRLFHDAPFSGSDITIFAIGGGLFVLGFHWFFRSMRSWSFRWTVALTGTGACVLLAIMSAVGVAHQVGWLLLSHEPLFGDRRATHIRELMELRRTAKLLANMASTNLVAAGSASALIANSRLADTYDGKRPWEKYHLLLLDGTNGYFALVWPRDERIHRRVGAATVTLDGDVMMQPTNYASSVIGRANTHDAKAY